MHVETRFYGKIKSKRVTWVWPGMVRYKLTAPATDSNGKTWKRGTEFIPFAGGHDNTVSQDYRDVVIVGGK